VLSQKNITSWPWIETAGRMNIRSQRYDKAEKLYTDYIAAAGKAPDVQKAYVALIELYCMQRQAPQAREAFDKFLALYQNDGAALRTCGSTIYPYYYLMSAKGRAQVLEIAEQALRRALDLLKEPAPKAQCMSDLGVVLTCAGRAKDAVPLFEQAIAAAPDPATKEERSLRLADALWKAGRLTESEALYNKLMKSQNTTIRGAAQTGQLYVVNERERQRRANPGK
jgi:tetratricopeptide (TPR) repeat protein